MGLECPFDDRQEMLRPDYEFFHSQGSRPLDIAYHSHDFYEVFLFVSGRAEYIIEGKTYALRPGDILLTNDRELHRPLVEPGRLYERYVLWIRPEYIRKLQEDGTDLAACFVDAARREYKRIRPGGRADRPPDAAVRAAGGGIRRQRLRMPGAGAGLCDGVAGVS